MKKNNKILIFLIIIILLFIHFFCGLNTINKLSPTYDEPLHLTAGYSYLKTNIYYLNIYDHPPLAEMIGAIPLLFMKPKLLIQHPYWKEYQQYSFANLFLYQNNIDASIMLNSGRKVILVFSCIFGLFIYLWTKQLTNSYFKGILCLIIYVFSCLFLSQATLVTTDLIFSLFYFLSFYAFWKWLNKPNISNTIFVGIMSGLTLCSKFSSIIIFGIYFILLLIYFKKINCSTKKIILHSILAILVCFFVIGIIYKFNIDLYFNGLYKTFTRLQKGRSNFLFGNYSTTGFWYYFLLVFLIKTPISFLVMLSISLYYILKLYKKYKFFNCLVIPGIIYFFFASISKVQIGIRHILPVFPFLIILSVLWLQKINYKKLLLVIFLFLWYIYSFIKIHPWHISYFNEFVGGPQQGYKYLTDSNIDWGQSLKELSEYLKSINCQYPVFLCYFGVGDPTYYGIKYFGFGFINNLLPQERPGDEIKNISELKKILLCVSVTNLQATYYANKEIFDWLKKINPDKKIAYSIFVYDLTNKPEQVYKLLDLLKSIGHPQYKTLQEWIKLKI